MPSVEPETRCKRCRIRPVASAEEYPAYTEAGLCDKCGCHQTIEEDRRGAETEVRYTLADLKEKAEQLASRHAWCAKGRKPRLHSWEIVMRGPDRISLEVHTACRCCGVSAHTISALLVSPLSTGGAK